MNTRNIRQTVSLLALSVVSCALLAGCGVGEASPDAAQPGQNPQRVPVEVVRATHSDIVATYRATASISSDADAPVVARVPGEVVELIAEEGDVVRTGQVLARLDGERLRLEMLAAKANLLRAQKEVERNADLHQRGLVSAAMFEALKFDLASLKASYDLKQLNYGYSNIRATISGVISARMIKRGENLTTGQATFRITATSELVAHLQIPQADLPKFKSGLDVTLSVASVPDVRFAATVVRISPTIDTRSGTFRATVQIDNSDGSLAPGMFGQFRIAYDRHVNALVIPARAILDEDDEATVYVVSDGEVSRKVIETGIENDGRVEVLKGLSNEEQIVVVGHSGLRDGSKVFASTSDQGNHSG